MSTPFVRLSGSDSQPPSSDLAAIAATLNEAAQALLELARANHAAPQGAAGAGTKPPESVSEPPASADEIRSYRIPQYILRDERTLLEMTDACELRDVLHKAYDHLHCLATLMKHYDPEENLCGFECKNIADVLSIPLHWLDSLAGTLSGFELVHQVKAE